MASETFTPEYSPWRHGGWYVNNVRYPSGACGCVSNNYPDKLWRIVCADMHALTFQTRDAAARGEYAYVHGLARANADLVKACADMLEYSAHLPVFGSEATVKNVRLAGKWIKACEDARAAIAKVEP